MRVALIIVGSVALLALALLLAPVTLSVRYDGGLCWSVRYLFFKILPRKGKPSRRKPAAPPSSGEKASAERKPNFVTRLFRENSFPDAVSELCAVISLLVKRFGRVMRRSVMRRFSLKLRIGGKDAASVALTYGGVCAALYPALGLLHSAMKFSRCEVGIDADYDAGKTTGTLDLRWSVRPLFVLGQLPGLIGELAGILGDGAPRRAEGPARGGSAKNDKS